MTRHFVLVTASYVENGKARSASGIRKLKRGVGIAQFIVDYLKSVDVHHDDTDIHNRGGTYVVVLMALPDGSRPAVAMSWNFTVFNEDELFSAVSHLTKDELLRDLHELLPLKAIG